MAYQFYVSIEGTKQGKFKGESTSARWKDRIAGLEFGYSVASPRDAASGQASGKRQHHPVTFTKEWGAATPLLFQALVTNEVLKKVVFEFVRTGADGQEAVYHTITLTNATVSMLEQFTSSLLQADQYGAHELERVSLTFQKIEVENKTGKTMAMDDWSVAHP